MRSLISANETLTTNVSVNIRYISRNKLSVVILKTCTALMIEQIHMSFYFVICYIDVIRIIKNKINMCEHIKIKKNVLAEASET